MQSPKTPLSVDQMFQLFEEAKKLLAKPKEKTISEKEIRRQKIEGLVSEWERRRQLDFLDASSEPTSTKKCRLSCTPFMQTLDEELKLYVCNRCGVAHECLLNENCKSTYIGEDRGIYCCFTKQLISEDYVNTFDGKFKPDQCEYDDGETAGPTETQHNALMDDNSVFQEQQTDDKKKATARPKAKTKKKAHLALSVFDVTKRQTKILNLMGRHSQRPKYINSLTGLCRERHLEAKYQEYCKTQDLEIATQIDNHIAEEDDEEPTIPTVTKLPKGEFVKQNAKALRGLFAQDAMDNNLVVPLYGTVNSYTSKRHASRLSDAKLDCVRQIIKDLLFVDNVRRALNRYYMDNARLKAMVMIRKYYKQSLRENMRPIMQHADDIFDHQIEKAKRFNFYPYDQNIVDFLSAVIFDCWFLALSTPRYMQKSSDFEIAKFAMGMLYAMRQDMRVDLVHPETNAEIVFVFLPKNNFLLHMLPEKNELCNFYNSHTKQKFASAHIKTGRRLFLQAIDSIDDATVKREAFEEIRSRFVLHRSYFLSNLEERS